MKLNFEVSNLHAKDVTVEQLTLNVDYSVDEFTTLVKTYPEIITLMSTLIKEL